MWRHPKYYKELRSIRNKLDQVISANKRDGGMKVRAPGPGLKPQATEASSLKPERQALSIKPKRQAKLRASSIKPAERQASSD